MKRIKNRFNVRFAVPLALGLACALPTMATTPPTVAFDAITAMAQTNYEGSVVTAHYTTKGLGGYTAMTFQLKVGNNSYVGAVDETVQTVTFAVPANVAVASNIYESAIQMTGTKDGEPDYVATVGAKFLYQGTATGAATANEWFVESGTSSGFHSERWADGQNTPTRDAENNKIVFEEDDDGNAKFAYTPASHASGKTTTVDMTLSFDAPLDVIDNDDYTNAQGAIRVVTVGDLYRFAVLDAGVWKTNESVAVSLDTDYALRMSFNYLAYPATIDYSAKEGNGEFVTLLAGAKAGGNKLGIERVAFNGNGKLSVMTATNVVDTLDASLVSYGANHYRWPQDVPDAQRDNLTLLWDMAWNPSPSADGQWTINAGSRNLYIDNTVTGVRVTNVDTTYTVIANYYELQKADDSSKKYMYLENALADTQESSFELLRDLTATSITLPRSLTFDFNDKAFVSGTVALGTHSLEITGGSTATAFTALTGTGTLTASASAPALLLKNVSGFAGSISVADGAGGIAIGPNVTAATTGKITLAADGSATIPTGKSWTAASGMQINGSLGGAGTLASAPTFGDGATLTSGSLTASGAPTFGATLTVTLAGAATGTTILMAPATSSEPAVTVNGETGYSLISKSGAIKLYKEAPVVFTVTEITETPSTNFNGSTVAVTYGAFAPGSAEGFGVSLTVNGHTYNYSGELNAGGGTITFNVANEDALAGQVESAIVRMTAQEQSSGSTLTPFVTTNRLYQGHLASTTTNNWFTETATNPQQAKWSPVQPTVTDGKFIITEDDDGHTQYAYTPSAQPVADAVVIEAQIVADAAMRNFDFDVSDVQGAVCVVPFDETYKFAYLDGASWKTNTDQTAAIGMEYTVRMTFDYSVYPAAIAYDLLVGTAYVSLGKGHTAGTKAKVTSIEFAGDGKLTTMSGSVCTNSVDPSLVVDGAGNRYANLDAAIGHDGLGLLWNTSWSPTSMPADFTLAANGYNLYFDGVKQGIRVVKNGENYQITGNYFEAMNVLFGDGFTTNKYTYLTTAVGAAEKDYEVYLLRDVSVDAPLAVHDTIAFYGETNVLTGVGFAVDSEKTLTIASGFIGITGISGSAELTGGRYTSASKTALEEFKSPSHSFAMVANPAKSGYVYQVIKGEEPTTDQEVLAVKDANGNDAGSIVLNKSWVETLTDKTEPADQVAILNTKQDNNLTVWENAVLGLTNGTGQVVSGNIPVAEPVQSLDTSTVMFKLGNVKVDADSGARVTYCVKTFSTPDAKVPENVSEEALPNANIAVPLPATGVKYYRLEVNATSK